MENRSKTKYSLNLFGAIGGVWQELARTTFIGTPRVELEMLGAEDPGSQEHQREFKTTNNCDEMVSMDSASKTKVLSEGQETKLKTAQIPNDNL